jgi:hypothetical protein
MKGVYIAAAVIILTLSSVVFGGTKIEESDRVRAVFIGNSLTYVNDLPAIVVSIAKAGGKKRFDFKTVAFPDFSLEDHWNEGSALNAIRKGGWNFVIMQQGPSAGREGREVLLKYAKLFNGEIRKGGAVPGMYMVWPETSRFGDLDGVRDSYSIAADEIDGAFFPASEAMRNLLSADTSIALFAKDNFHPNQTGSLLAALVIFEQIYGVSLSSFSGSNLKINGRPPHAVFEKPLTAASKANQQYARKLAGTHGEKL